MGKKRTDVDLEWERRTLCSDGNCIGVIGPDGKCKECGKPYAGDLPEASGVKEHIPDEAEAHEEAPATVRESTTETSDDSHENLNSEWENRRLCSDGNCIGVIGPDGKCKECGKPFEE